MFFLLHLACRDHAEECATAKAQARKAWGELEVSRGVALAQVEDEVQEREGRLAALDRRPGAPAEGKAVLNGEIDTLRVRRDALTAPIVEARAVRDAFARGQAAAANARAQAAVDRTGADRALALGQNAAQVCASVE